MSTGEMNQVRKHPSMSRFIQCVELEVTKINAKTLIDAENKEEVL